MSRSTTRKLSTDNRSVAVKGIIKPDIPDFPGRKAPTAFKPGARFQSINRGRR